VVFILLLLLAIVGWFFIKTETAREERVEFVLCIRNETYGLSLRLWDAKLTDSTFFSPLRGEHHANMSAELQGPGGIRGGMFRSQEQYLLRVEPGSECEGGIQIILTSSNSSDYMALSWADKGQSLDF
jgi:hypothetical protein